VFTFDDGPNPKTTPAVLDALAAHHIHAIFFMVGEMAGNPSKKIAPLVARILREGHVIATHTMTHKDLCRKKTSDEAAAKEIDDGKATIERVAHVKTGWFRAPYGSRCERLEKLLAERGLKHFHWDLDPQEWKHGHADKAFKYVTTELGKASGRNVLLMHDIKEATVKALPQILDWIDAENARREKAHKRPIRVVQSYDLAWEQAGPGLAWVGDATAGVRALPAAIATALP
jgi:peptidoglycan/xylan/chitin deacetylase (PgdA/CDA1 family)